ncbi:SRPBCC family protein [Streptomyces sp. NPDC003077]|uniref:SRPBCC family protein n=1 Tax=Streptomyces sp. NPDC003077 TaxID=3154443 RepID=UPI0033AED5C4
MAVRHVLIPAPPSAVWSVLCDGRKYQRWVVGPRTTEHMDDHWPEPGAAVRYRVGTPMWSFEGQTLVRACDPGERLELEAQAGCLGSARISIQLQPWGDGCLVVVDEHPLRGVGASAHNLALEAVLNLRNRRMLKKLTEVVMETHREETRQALSPEDRR